MPTAEVPDPKSSDVIVNPSSGERIRIRPRRTHEPDVLVWELWLRPGGHVPSTHVHPRQTETFHVLSGRLKFRLGPFRRRVVGPGEQLTVSPGQAHHFATLGGEEVHALIESRPALQMEELLRVAAALATRPDGAVRRLPRPSDLLLFMDDFAGEVRAPYLPRALVRRLVGAVTWGIRKAGRDKNYASVRDRWADTTR